MRINILTNAPYAPTGYGVESGLLIPRLQKMGHAVSATCYYGLEGGVLNWDGGGGPVTLYPKAYDPYGNDVMAAHAATFKSDILLTNMDTWVLNPAQMIHGVRWVPWMPIDHDPCPPVIIDKVRLAFARICYSKFGQAKLKERGLDSYYAPMSVDTNVYKPIENRANAKKLFAGHEDKFLVGIVAMNKGNPSRKAFTEQLDGFAAFHAQHPDSLLYLHTQRGPEMGGINLASYCAFLGLKEGQDVVFSDQYNMLLGFQVGYMNQIYNAMDVLLSVTCGEGFGVPIIEAQAAGTPVIVGGWTSMSELCFAGQVIPAKGGADRWWTPLEAYQFRPRSKPIAQALAWAYKFAREDKVRERARRGALEYDADAVAEKYWKPVLEDIKRKIDALGVQYQAVTK